jgi:hypothetical protein
MKKILLCLIVFNFKTSIAQKIFTLDPVSPGINLNGANGSCALPGTLQPNVFSVTVSDVGLMNSTNQLTLVSIGLSDCGSGSKNLNEVQIRLISPSGVCMGVYNGGLSTIATGTHYINLVSNAPCVNNPNTSNEPNVGAPLTSSGNNGYYNAQFSGVNANYSSFTGSADGVWRIVFSESTANPPCVEVIRLFFGDPTVKDLSTQGDNCSNPIVWDGNYQICSSTSGKTGSTQMPGSIGGPNTNTFGTISGQTCGWNFANNNEVWIKYTAEKTTTCLTVSGISGTNVSLQSIVVTDANRDGDNNPCTQIARTSTNDPNWMIASCPRPSVYQTTAGTQYNQQHCFTSEVGKDYYLVVDGDGGANSKFHVWGFDFNGVLNLENNKTNPRTKLHPILNINNGVIISKNNKPHKQSITIYNSIGSLLFKSERFVNKDDLYDVKNYTNSGFNLIKVVIDDNIVHLFKYVKK